MEHSSVTRCLADRCSIGNQKSGHVCARLVNSGLDLFSAGPGKIVCKRHILCSGNGGQAGTRAANAVGVPWASMRANAVKSPA